MSFLEMSFFKSQFINCQFGNCLFEIGIFELSFVKCRGFPTATFVISYFVFKLGSRLKLCLVSSLRSESVLS